MLETKFTKGEWRRVVLEKTNYYNRRNEIHYGNDGECIAEFVQNDYDALLISKSPQMLEMLQELLEDLEDVVLPTSIFDTISRAKKLIKSATEL